MEYDRTNAKNELTQKSQLQTCETNVFLPGGMGSEPDHRQACWTIFEGTPDVLQKAGFSAGKQLAKLVWVAIFTVLPLAGYGQRLQVSPMSMHLWGHSPQVAKVSLAYRSVEAVYLYGFKTMYDHQGAAFGGGYAGLFWYPLAFEKDRFKASGGIGYFSRKYPTINGTHINFSLRLAYRISKKLSIQYSHISNGFGLLNGLNPGVDNIGLVIAL